MTDYFEFLFKESRLKSQSMKNARLIINTDEDSFKIFFNSIFDAELYPSIVDLVDYAIIPYTTISSQIDIVAKTEELKGYSSIIPVDQLKNIFNSHYSTVHRLGAFSTGFLLQADIDFNSGG